MNDYMGPCIWILIFEIHPFLDNLDLRLCLMSPPMPMPSMAVLDIPRMRPVMTMIAMHMILILMSV